MHFLNEVVLWALAVVPPVGAILVWLAWRRKQQLQAFYGEEQLVTRYSKPARKEVYQFKALWVFLALACFVVALARPSFQNGLAEFPSGSVDVIAVVDVSRSMAAQDYKGKLSGYYWSGGTRLDMARYLIVNEVVPSIKANHIGVVSYSGEAFPQAFLTDDLPALQWALKRALTVSSAPGEGSNLIKAFDLAFTLYDVDSNPGRKKIIVLFSDGGNDDGAEGLGEIAAECRKRDIELVVVGLGKTTPSAIPVSQLSPADQESMRGKEWYEVDGEIVRTALDENTLRYLANASGGRYTRVDDPSDFRLGSLISSVEVKYKKGEQEVFMYPLLLALLFVVLAVVAPLEPASTKPNTAKPGAPRVRTRR
ncbi:MAG TPA: VWA domain-containing protein [Candidatus Obscuribacterales bacterium]